MGCHGYREVAGYWPSDRMMAESGPAFEVVQDGVGITTTQVCIWAEASLIFALLGLFLMVVSLSAGALVDSLGVASGVLALIVIGRCRRRQHGLGYALLGILLAAAPLVLMILSGV